MYIVFYIIKIHIIRVIFLRNFTRLQRIDKKNKKQNDIFYKVFFQSNFTFSLPQKREHNFCLINIINNMSRHAKVLLNSKYRNVTLYRAPFSHTKEGITRNIFIDRS